MLFIRAEYVDGARFDAADHVGYARGIERDRDRDRCEGDNASRASGGDDSARVDAG